MRTIKLAVIGSMVFFGTLATVAAQPKLDPRGADAAVERKEQARAAATEKRRQWILDQVRQRTEDPGQLAGWRARLDAMSAAEVDAAAAIMLEELERDEQIRGKAMLQAARNDQYRHEERRQQEVARQSALVESMAARRDAELAAAAAYAAGFHPTVGWAPALTWLPTGASLTASATILPGGRIRTSVWPFFSTVGPVDYFSPYTGYGYPPYSYPYPYSYGAPWFSPYPQHIYIERYLNGGQHHHGHHGGHFDQGHGGGRYYHDGLRTRVRE